MIGTEQLQGFAVTLVLGLVVNLFTAVFCARVVFDVAERQAVADEAEDAEAVRRDEDRLRPLS